MYRSVGLIHGTRHQPMHGLDDDNNDDGENEKYLLPRWEDQLHNSQTMAG